MVYRSLIAYMASVVGVMQLFQDGALELRSVWRNKRITSVVQAMMDLKQCCVAYRLKPWVYGVPLKYLTQHLTVSSSSLGIFSGNVSVNGCVWTSAVVVSASVIAESDDVLASVLVAVNESCAKSAMTACTILFAMKVGCLLSGSATFSLPGLYSQVNWKRDSLSAHLVCLGDSQVFVAKKVFGLWSVTTVNSTPSR